MLHLENLALAIAKRKRLSLGATLRIRYKRYSKEREDVGRQLNSIIGTMVSYENNGPQFEITDALLQEQAARQRSYFATISPSIHKPHFEVYELVRREKDLREGRLMNAYGELERTSRDLDALLVQLNQTRDEWKEGGERWTLASRLKDPNHDIFKALVDEETLRLKFAQAQLDNSPPNEQAKIAAKLDRAKKATDDLLDRSTTNRADWQKGQRLWDEHNNMRVIANLELIYHRILRSAASRAMEFRNLKGRVSGRKQAERMLRMLMSRYPAMERDIQAFNTQLDSLVILSGLQKPPRLSMAAFRESTGEDQGVGPKARDALFQLQLCKSSLFLGSQLDGSKELWAMFPNVQTGIELRHRSQRLEEELTLLTKEWKRVETYTYHLLLGMWQLANDTTIANTSAADIVDNVWKLIWSELQGAHILVAAARKSDGVFECDRLSRLVESLEYAIDQRFRKSELQVQVLQFQFDGVTSVDPLGGRGRILLRPRVANVGLDELEEAFHNMMNDPINFGNGADNGDGPNDLEGVEEDGYPDDEVKPEDDGSDSENENPEENAENDKVYGLVTENVDQFQHLLFTD